MANSNENYTDPYVFHDPIATWGTIVIPYEPDHALTGRDDGAVGTAHNYEHEKTHGVLWPIIQINKRMINHEQIEQCIVYYTDFMPKIMLKIHDYNSEIQAMDVPGLNNMIQIALVPSIKNTYKTIKLAFQIDDVKIMADSVIYYGTYKLAELSKEFTKEIIYPGCSSSSTSDDNNVSVKCNSSESKQPNTWEYLHEIAKYTGLGFASTQNCQDIQDRLPRLVRNMTY